MRGEWNEERDDTRDDLLSGEAGIIKYGIAYLLGVPLTLLVLIFLVARGC